MYVTHIVVQGLYITWQHPCPGLSPDEFVAIISSSLFV
jgi:hypothetical protein